MTWIKSIAREILGLFVDDGSFAIAILLWLALIVLIATRLASPAPWQAPALFLGLAIILIESVLRYARNKRR